MEWLFDAQVRAAALYGVVSFLMNFANKAVFADTEFDSVYFLLLVQFLFTIVSLHAFKAAGLVEFEPFTVQLAKDLAIPSVMYCVNVGLALTSLSAVSIPVYQVLKRLTPAATVVISKLILGKNESLSIHLSIFVMVSGTMLTGLGDLRFDFIAYMCGIGSVFSQCLYLLYIQKSGLVYDVLTMMYGNSVNCIVLLVLQDLVSGNIQQAFLAPDLMSLNLWLHVSVVLVLGMLLNYSMFLCTTANSALSTTVVGVLKAVFSTLLGFFTFGGQPVTLLLCVGVVLNTAGAVWYMYIRYHEKGSSRGQKRHSPSAEHSKDDEELASLTNVTTTKPR